MLQPPPGVLLAYRLVGWRVGPAYREWVLSDITRRGWLLRQGAPAVATVLLLGVSLTAALDGDIGRLVALVFVLTALGAFLRSSLRERALRLQGLDAAGHQLKDATWYADDAARRRRNVLSATSTVLLVVGALVILALRSAP